MNSEEFEQSYREIYTIRLFEETIARIYSDERIRCPVHLAIGHEASAVGVCRNLSTDDKVFSYHRSHHHFLAKGGSASSLLKELMGEEDGCSGGRGGSTHLISESHGFMGSSAIISGVLPVAAGYAHSILLQKQKNIVVVFLGDAAPEEGVFFESLNIAKLWKLPLLIVIEDNDLSCYTSKSIRQSYKSFESIAQLFEVPFYEADGSDLEDSNKNAKKAIDFVRAESKPALLKINVFRALEHCGPEKDDLLSYRNINGEWPEKDPLFVLRKKMNRSRVEEIELAVQRQNEKLFQDVYWRSK